MNIYKPLQYISNEPLNNLQQKNRRIIVKLLHSNRQFITQKFVDEPFVACTLINAMIYRILAHTYQFASYFEGVSITSTTS